MGRNPRAKRSNQGAEGVPVQFLVVMLLILFGLAVVLEAVLG